MKMPAACLLFLFLIMLSSTVFAESIAISPNSIDVTNTNFNSSFILINSNDIDLNYTITASSDSIAVESSDFIGADSNKEIPFVIQSLKEDSYIIIKFESENTITPSITLKLIKSYEDSDAEQGNASIIQEDEQENQTAYTPPQAKINQSQASQIISPQKSSKNNSDLTDFLYIVGAVIVLLLAVIISIPKKKKHCTGHIGQKLRIFINKLS